MRESNGLSPTNDSGSPLAQETSGGFLGASSPILLSVAAEAVVFRRMRRRVLSTFVRQLFSQSRFRVTLVIVLTTLLWGGMFWMFGEALWFFQTSIACPETFAVAVSGMFSTFFFVLTLMLMFSAAVILYGSLFRSREIAFLLTSPARTGRVFLDQFHQAVVLCSWGFVLLGSPGLLAYGVVVGAPWHFYVVLVPFVVSFVYIPVALGAIACMLLVRFFPTRIVTVLVSAGAMILSVGIWMAWRLVTVPSNNLLTAGWFREILDRMQVSDVRLMPSWWLSTGLFDAAGTAWGEGLLFLALMIANALLLRQLAMWTAERTLRAAYSGLSNKGLRRKRTHSTLLDRLLDRLMRPLPATIRLMTIKDARLFRRDPLQWSQVLIFAGFMIVYFLYVPSFTSELSAVVWVNMISFLNLAVVGLLLSTFTTRFVFPMLSLEGRRFWILAQLGVRRETILWGKFLYALGGAIIPCCGLVLLSDVMLGVHAIVIASHQLTCVVLCLGLAGIAVGLGAWLPNLREESPSRIAAGFGGTLTLVTSTLFIMVVVLLTALPTHFYLAAHYASQVRDFEGRPHLQSWFLWWWIAGTIISVLIGALATYLPMRVGFRAFRRQEF